MCACMYEWVLNAAGCRCVTNGRNLPIMCFSPSMCSLLEQMFYVRSPTKFLFHPNFSFSSANFLRFLTVLSLYPLSSTFIDITRTDIRFVDRAVIGR